jgi:hypothetical protein
LAVEQAYFRGTCPFPPGAVDVDRDIDNFVLALNANAPSADNAAGISKSTQLALTERARLVGEAENIPARKPVLG